MAINKRVANQERLKRRAAGSNSNDNNSDNIINYSVVGSSAGAGAGAGAGKSIKFVLIVSLLFYLNNVRNLSKSTKGIFMSMNNINNIVQEREVSQALDQYSNRIWQKHYDDMDENATAGLLRMFNCPMYSDRFGIQGGSSTQLPYSRIPTEDETWKLFEDAYYFALGIKSPKKKQSRGSGGMQVPLEVRYDRQIGRSVHATSFIPKGALLWESSRTVAFTDTKELVPEESTTESHKKTSISVNGTKPIFHSYRRFLEYLHDHQIRTNDTIYDGIYDWTCDALMWTYPGDNTDNVLNEPEVWGVCISFDYGSMFNDAKGDENATNILGFDCGTVKVKEGYPRDRIINDSKKTMSANNSNTSDSSALTCLCYQVYASRDIQPGEELRYDYEFNAEE